MEIMKNTLLLYLVFINILGFLVYGVDKFKARRNMWRIPEWQLLMVALVGGSIGAFLGMRVFHHKTKKPKFYIGVPVIFVLQVLGVLGIYFGIR